LTKHHHYYHQDSKNLKIKKSSSMNGLQGVDIPKDDILDGDRAEPTVCMLTYTYVNTRIWIYIYIYI
jgi:hypothetical protein